jgi:hypothetical protein
MTSGDICRCCSRSSGATQLHRGGTGSRARTPAVEPAVEVPQKSHGIAAVLKTSEGVPYSPVGKRPITVIYPVYLTCPHIREGHFSREHSPIPLAESLRLGKTRPATRPSSPAGWASIHSTRADPERGDHGTHSKPAARTSLLASPRPGRRDSDGCGGSIWAMPYADRVPRSGVGGGRLLGRPCQAPQPADAARAR